MHKRMINAYLAKIRRLADRCTIVENGMRLFAAKSDPRIGKGRCSWSESVDQDNWNEEKNARCEIANPEGDTSTSFRTSSFANAQHSFMLDSYLKVSNKNA